jgi:transporter family-2 protein
MGATLVLSGVMLSHRLGAATFIGCVILGQLAASVTLDHFGLVGFPQHSVTVPRLAGLCLLATGVYLIRRF